MLNNLMDSLKNVGRDSPIENPIKRIEEKIDDIDKTAQKYVTFALVGLGLILAIKVVGVVD